MLSYWGAAKRALLGRPFRNERLSHALLPKRTALPVYASDALSSVAYAPDEILITLAVAGASAVAFSPWVGAAVMLVLLTVVASYRQNVRAYPSGGGDYEIASTNLGWRAGLVVGSALLVDYVLTVAVSMSAASQYVVTAVPVLHGSQAVIAVVGIAVLALINLRGVREAGAIFAVPVYLFMAAILIMCLIGIAQAATGQLGRAPSAGFDVVPAANFDNGLVGLAGALLLMRAFSSGAAALTGVEAISNGVPNFRKPKSKNAATTLLLLGTIAATMFAGILFLATATGARVVQDPASQLTLNGRPPGPGYVQHPAISQLAEAVFGDATFAFYLVVGSTGLILVLACNTAFNGFPVLASMLASDGYLPRQMRTRGDRLTFSNGILVLAAVAIALVAVFNADVTSLIHLYVVGVFISFTTSQLGMARHWTRRLRLTPDSTPRLHLLRSRRISTAGCAMTGLVLVIVMVTKFTQGAWLAVLAMAILYASMRRLNLHYARTTAELAVEPETVTFALPSRVHALILVSHVHKPLLRTVAFARACRPARLDAVTVDIDPEETARTIKDWEETKIPVPLTVLASPYRETLQPVIDHIRSIHDSEPRTLVEVYIPEYVLGRWWENLVHNQTALRIKARLHYEPGVIITSVPWRMASSAALTAELDRGNRGLTRPKIVRNRGTREPRQPYP